MRTVWVWLVWRMVSLGTVAGYLKIKNWGVFWDANVYKTALQNWQNGASPYFTEDSLPYLYPPISLDLFDLITVDPRAVVIVFNCFGFILLTRALLGLSNGVQRPL